VVGGIWIVMMQYSLVWSILRYNNFPGSLSLSRVKKTKVNDIVTVLLSAWISDKRTVLNGSKASIKAKQSETNIRKIWYKEWQKESEKNMGTRAKKKKGV
jgi:hypothetical protein